LMTVVGFFASQILDTGALSFVQRHDLFICWSLSSFRMAKLWRGCGRLAKMHVAGFRCSLPDATSASGNRVGNWARSAGGPCAIGLDNFMSRATSRLLSLPHLPRLTPLPFSPYAAGARLALDAYG
jgi:hypothetical protein